MNSYEFLIERCQNLIRQKHSELQSKECDNSISLLLSIKDCQCRKAKTYYAEIWFLWPENEIQLFYPFIFRWYLDISKMSLYMANEIIYDPKQKQKFIWQTNLYRFYKKKLKCKSGFCL